MINMVTIFIVRVFVCVSSSTIILSIGISVDHLTTLTPAPQAQAQVHSSQHTFHFFCASAS
jgi:hypothetical protein